MDLVEIGRLGKTHGIKGELKSRISDDFVEHISEILPPGQLVFLEVKGFKLPYRIRAMRNRDIVLSFQKVHTVEQARELVNAGIYVERKLISGIETKVELHEQLLTFFIFDLNSDQIVGEIERVEDNPAHPLLLVRSDDGRECIIPFAEQWIEDMDLEKQTIYMNLPDGLLDLES